MCKLMLKDRYCDSLSAIKAVSVLRRKRKRFAGDRNLNICRANQSHKENFLLVNNNMRTAEETKLSLALLIA